MSDKSGKMKYRLLSWIFLVVAIVLISAGWKNPDKSLGELWKALAIVSLLVTNFLMQKSGFISRDSDYE